MKTQVKAILASATLMLMSGAFLAQAQKRAMTIEDVMNYKRITHQAISDNGQWSVAVSEAWRGDGDPNGRIADYAGDATAQVFDNQGRMIREFCPINGYKFSKSSSYLVVSTHESEVARNARALKAQNGGGAEPKGRGPKGGDDAKLDTLYIYNMSQASVDRIDSVRNYKVSDNADWIAYQLKAKDSTLYVRTMNAASTFTAEKVTSYGFAKKGDMMYYNTLAAGAKKAPDTTRLYLLPLETLTPVLLKEGIGQQAEGMTFNETGSKLAFYWGTIDKKALRGTGKELWLIDNIEVKFHKKGKDSHYSNGFMPRKLTDSINSVFPKGFVVSPNGRLSFAKDNSRLYFGTALAPRMQDTLQLKKDRPGVQVWSGNEPVQYTVQNFSKERDSRRTYQAVCWLNDGRIMQLADSTYDAQTSMNGNGRYALLTNSRPYSNSSMWEGRSRSDIAVLDMQTGERKEIAKADYTRYRLSPTGKYAYAYAETDSCWRSIDLATGEIYTLTTPQTFPAWDEDNDVPDYPRSHGVAGVLPNDEGLIIYDRYDLWQVPVKGGNMIRLTLDGRENKRQYRLQVLDTEKVMEEGIDMKGMQLLTAFDEATKSTSFYVTSFKRPAKPAFLAGGENYKLGGVLKAKNANVMLWTRENFQTFPDIQYSVLDKNWSKFASTVQLTHFVDQQKDFFWGSAELVNWTSYKGVKLEGLLFKPENFDASKKYPVIVYYYERNSETLNDYRIPQPARSYPDFHSFVSQGYVFFVPDIRYVDGHPGECCYDCVMSGLDMVESLGFVDKDHIGTCGHSWGGYQSAYLSTRTDRFAAIESGAPVVNMFSAYGGIRWGSGMARSFQYEHTQSRIGASPWEAPELYKENSSLFNFDKVTTPILIMHNDADGHVPWYQGIEMFVALKRLGKPAWMLNYTGEPHWPVKMANRKDFQIRLKGFFDHYLKGAPAPKWLSEGIPAVDQPYELGY